MSIKHVNEYYSQICSQYKEMIQDIKDLEKEAEQGLVEPERIKRLEDQVAPIKTNYERWSYMMYLLNLPTRKEKQKRYERQNKKFLKAISDTNKIDAIICICRSLYIYYTKYYIQT